MIGCTEFGFVIENDDETKRLERAVMNYAKADSAKAIVCAGYLNSPEFIKHCFQDKAVIKDIEEKIKEGKITGEPNIKDVNLNILSRVLREYYEDRHFNVMNFIAARNGEILNGFSSAKAKSEALDHTANLLIELYYANLVNPKNERLSRLDIVNKVMETIESNFNNIAIPILRELANSTKKEDIENYNKAKKVNIELKNITKEINAKIDKYQEAINSNNEELAASLDKELTELNKEKARLKTLRYLAFSNIVDIYGNPRQKNYSALVKQIRGNANEWFTNTFMCSKLTNLVREFEELTEGDKIKNSVGAEQDEDVENDGSTSYDESSKSWEDKLYASFDKAVGADIKLYFNTLYQLNSPAEWGQDTIEKVDKDGKPVLDKKGKPIRISAYNYDTNNELGVPTTMGANYIITQLSNYGDFSSLNAFVNSIYKASHNVQSLYGLSQLVNKMINDPIFANRVFTQLANPKIKKTIVRLAENGIEFDQSNKTVEAMTYMIFNMFNSLKNTYRNRFSESDIITINNYKNSIDKIELESIFTDSDYNVAEKYDEFIKNYLIKYFPNINLNAIRKYLNEEGKSLKNHQDMMTAISNLQNKIKEIVYDYGQIYDEYREELDAYNVEKHNFYHDSKNIGKVFTKAKPVFDITGLDFNKLYAPIINIVKKIQNYDSVKNELNTINAEGNLASDLIGNNYITNLFKQIDFSTKENAFAGLENLRDEISKGHQYDYSPIYFGVQNAKGETIVPGLFIKRKVGENTTIEINPDAKNILKVSLFDGAKDNVNAKAAMYSGMSKGDYFLTQLIAFNNPVGFDELVVKTKQQLDDNYAGFFMRTPSDAPKNFIIQAPKYSIQGLWKTINSSKTAYIESVKNNIASKYKFVNEDLGDVIMSVNQYKRNTKSASEIYSILTDNEIENIKYADKKYIEDRNKNIVEIPIVYKTDSSIAVIYLKGNIVPGTIEKIAENLVVDRIVSLDNGVMSNNLSNDFYGSIVNTIVDEGLESGAIEVQTNRDNAIFRGFKTHLLNELNNYIYQLNNVFRKEGRTWVTREDKNSLFDRVHFNGNIVEDGKLSGKFFKFQKLFETNNYNVEKAIEELLFLYGGSNALFIKTKSGLKINNKRIITKNTKTEDLTPMHLINEVNGELRANINNEVSNLLDNIVEEWINNFHKEILNRTSQYKTILESISTKYNSNDISEFIYNTAIAEMNFDDLFEGDSKFYKNAQDFLKRAKEVQAAGKAYAGFDIADKLSERIHNTVGVDGKTEQIIKVNGKEYLCPIADTNGNVIPNSVMKARNGFRAITIYNTVRPSEQAGRIKQELIDILTPKVGFEQAEVIANQIASGYADLTKVNDAQSYITIEEFIRRRFADGTLNEYQDILKQLNDLKEGKINITDIDLEGIKARIQVQKNFYFDKKFDTNTNTHYVRQIKNAEFVLIPELIQGTELYDLYQLMRKHDIGQVNTIETSKAAKKDILTYWDNEGKVNPNFEKELIADGSRPIEDFYYRYLYKQQDVPQHLLDEHNKAGIQIMKKILDNANDEVKPYINNFFKAYCANIKEDFNKLINNMGWIVGDDGTLLRGKQSNETENEYLERITKKKDDTDDDYKYRNQLQFDEFYKKARQEAQRLGLDSNFIEYLTPDVLGNPKMPNYMNNVSTKLESIAQAIFNSAVTRQTLPGWHAAQVTSVGHGAKVLGSNGQFRTLQYHPSTYINNDTKDVISVEEYKALKEKDKENYTLHNESYAEIMIPKWSKHLIYKPTPKLKEESEEQYTERIKKEKAEFESNLLAKLQKEGLDIHIGYRIPTEGKQSVSVFKVVGFLDDIYGSTIMVPDEWVTQTGSDFDVDSVYGICYKMNRNLKRITIDYDGSHEGDRRRYIKYVTKALRIRIEKDLITDVFKKDAIQKAYESIYNPEEIEANNVKFKELCLESNELWKNLPKDLKDEVRRTNEIYNEKERIVRRYISVSNSAYDYETTNKKVQKIVNKFAEVNKSIAVFLNETRADNEEKLEDFRKAKDKAIEELFEEARENHLHKVEAKAKEFGLIPFDKFVRQSIIEQNDRDARDNMLLESMVKIMENANSREENYSRSNFDDLVEAMKYMDNLRGASKVLRSAYNPLDQIDFMENAMSGAQLKAFSVTRDTFNSVNNYTKSELNVKDGITVIYNAKDYDVNNAIEAYGINNITLYNKYGDIIKSQGFIKEEVYSFKVHHIKFGNSNNNRNIVGKLLTPYSSQTTAHILDAIKEGAIYNENDYTFGTFKTLIDVGIDYHTAIGFLMQPGITRIVNANNAVKSIYINSSYNPIQAAVKEIANELGITINGEKINTYTPFKTVVSLLNNNVKLREAFYNIFNITIDDKNSFFDTGFTLDRKQLEERLKPTVLMDNEDVEHFKYVDAAMDLAMIATFNKVHNTTKRIEELARCSNPDRFGAKQTIRATRETVEKIYKYSNDSRKEYEKANRKTEKKTVDTYETLLVNGKPLLNALYPGLVEGEGINVENSAYPYLAAFLKYATLPSVEANKQLFSMENEIYADITNSVQNKLGIHFNDEQYKEYKQYMVSDIYSNIQYLNTPLTINNVGQVILDLERIKEITEDSNKYWNKERSRIFGYDITESGYFDAENINRPTADDIKRFNKLTPAQKVIWIQEHFIEGKGIFEFLNINTFNQYEYKNKGYTSQTIRFNDSIDNIEELFRAFRNSFFNKNPFIKLAAIDLIKYAFVVEGFKFKKGGISKLITNDSLYSNIENMGMDIINVTDKHVTDRHGVIDMFELYSNAKSKETISFIDKFIRSHSEYARQINMPKPKSSTQGNKSVGHLFLTYSQGNNMFFIPYNTEAKPVLEQLGLTELDDEEFGAKSYVRINQHINKQSKTVLYKIKRTTLGVYLYPLNILERNETSEFSANNANNIYRSSKYYETLIGNAHNYMKTVKEVLANKENKLYELKEDGKINIEEEVTIEDLNNKYKITPHKFTQVIETTQNPNTLLRISTNGSKKEVDSINNFFTKLEDYFKLPVERKNRFGVVLHNDNYLASLIPVNTSIIQNIPVNDRIITVKISRYKPNSNDFYKLVRGEKADYKKILDEEWDVLNQMQDNGLPFSILYKVEQIETKNEEIADDVKYAISESIDSIDLDSYIDLTDSEKVAKSMFKDLEKRANSQTDIAAEKAVRRMNVINFDDSSNESIHDNKRNLYNVSADYYVAQAHTLLKDINEFVTTNADNEQTDKVYSIDNPALYKHLINNPQDYPRLVKLILDAKTFGGQFYEIFNLDVTSEDDDTRRAIEKIKEVITEVRNNTKLKRAVELLFNDYIANNFSTNPLIRQGLIELRTTFGDTDWFDLNFSSVGELDNKQVQTVVKYVYAIIDEANKIIAPKAVNTFTKQFEDIMKGEGKFDWDNIVTSEGKFISPYTEDFLKDKEDIKNNLNNIKETYGEDSIEYVRAKLKRDKWRADNIEQLIKRDYYVADVALREKVLASAPNEYVKYMKLIHELYSDTRAFNTLSQKEKDRRKEINYQIKVLMSDFNEDDSLKSFEGQYKAKILRDYIEEKRKLNAEYFKFDETEGFKNNLKYYRKILENYEKEHPNEFLDDRLKDRTYKEAYDWIQANSIYTLDEDSRKEISEAFKVLKDEDNVKSKFIKRILKAANAYDDYGNIDPRKLDPDQIEAIRKRTQYKFNREYDSNAGDAILIRDIPNGLPVYTNEFYRMLRDPSESAQNPRRIELIGRINELISYGVNTKSGHIEAELLFKNLTEEELEELGALYTSLRAIKSKRKPKEIRQNFAKYVEFKTHDEQFNVQKAWALANLKGRQYDLWSNIFEEINDEDLITPNSHLYGYIEPKVKKNEFIDEAKTKARKLIEQDLKFVTTEYYEEALKEATKQGKFEEWYKANHVYNPYTHRMEPLKIWTKMIVSPTGKFKGKYEYVPTYENTERTVKDEYVNPEYKNYSMNYNSNTGHYNNRTNLSTKEKEILKLLQSTINAYATTYQMKKFAEDGYLPRRAKYEPDTRWYLNQAIGATGLEFRNTGEHKWSEMVDYTRDRDADFDMMSILKQKGYKQTPDRPQRGTESEEEYDKIIEAWKEDKKRIEAENLKLDNAILDRDWKSVFQDFIAKATDYQARQRAKNTIYLLLEDLKDNDAYSVSRYSGNVMKDNKLSTRETTYYKHTPQTNTYNLVQNWARRVLYKEFKKNNKLTKWADLMQNVTSAKYMIFNVTGGIANVGTGLANIMNEVFAREYFDGKTYTEAVNIYRQNCLSMIADMYNPTSNNLYVAITKYFNIVDFDAFNERRPNETATEYVKRVRDSLYAFQSGGEHFMQNTALFAMLKSHRIFKDVDGTVRIGSLSNYIWKLESTTLINILSKNNDYYKRYMRFLKQIKNDANELKKYDTFTKDINEEFLRDLGDRDIIFEYIKARKEAIKQAKKEFYSDANPTVLSLFELKDGYAVPNVKDELSRYALSMFGKKVESVNQKIHGVYDKIGAAKIEAEWWGSLVMQYHKHIYPGIMKRYRTKGYYNEIRESIERGSHISLAKFATAEFRGIGKRIENRTDDENIAIKSIEEIAKSIVNTITNIELNWGLMPEWEKANIRRNLGDIYGVLSAMSMAFAIYGITDDDDTKESDLIAASLYISDRLMSEAQMYTPWGVFNEAKTLWSSPIAAQNGPKDLMKALGIIGQWLYDDEYNINYTTGLYKGQNKLEVLLYRNTPIYRVYQRLSNMTKNNNYYRINETALNLKLAKGLADELIPD